MASGKDNKAKRKKKKADQPSTKSFKIPKSLVFNLSLLILAILVFFIRYQFIDIPLERDEGDYALAGKLILEGAKPYVDVFEQKPPGLFYSYAVVSLFFGTTAQGLHLGFIFVNILTMGFIAYAMRFLVDEFAGIGSAASFLALSMNPYISGYSIQAEHLLVFNVSVSFFFLALFYRSKQLWNLIAAGAFVAISATIKQNGVFFIGIVVLGVFAMHWNKNKLNFKKLTKEYPALAIGGFSIFALLLLGMLIQGVWDEFIFWAITFPREFYVSAIPLERGLEYLQAAYNRISGFNPWLWYTSLIGFVIVFLSPLNWPKKIWFLMVLLLSFFSVWPGFRFYGHYWIQFIFGLSLGLGLLAYSLRYWLQKLIKPQLSGIVVSSLLALFLILLIAEKGQYFFSPSGEQIMNNIYGDNPFMESRKIAEFIKSKNPNPEVDKILVFGSEPQIILETGLDSPTPHTFMVFVASQHPASAAWRAEYLAMLDKNEAKYAVIVVHPFSWLVNGEEANQFFAQGYRKLMSNYRVIGVADIISKQQTIYKWDAEATSYDVQGQKYVLVLERDS